MQIGSIVINGLERVAQTLLREFEIVKESGDRMGAARMIILYNPHDSGMLIEPGQQIDIYRAIDEESSTASTLWGSTSAIFGEPLFGEATPSEKIFSGAIVNCEPQVMMAQRSTAAGGSMWGDVLFGSPLFTADADTERVNCVRIEARDNNYILESTIVSGTFTSVTDKSIITSLFAAAPSVDITDVASTATISSLTITDETLRSALNKIAERTGAVYYVDSNLAFHYFLPSARAAAFSLSESPDNLTSFAFERSTFRFTKEWRAPANRVTIIGKVGSGGVSISRTRNDATSQSLYGIKAITIVDRQISTNGEADARGDVELAKRANPQYGGTLVTYVDGLLVCDYLTIDAAETMNLNAAYTVRRIQMRWLNKSTTRYEVEWGAYQPDIARTIRKLYDATLETATVLPTTPAPSTVGTGTIIPGSVTGGSGGSLASATIEQANMGNASIGSAQIQSASIQEAHIGNLEVSNAKIQDAAITTAKIGNLEVTNAKIAGDLSAAKIVTGDLSVGGTGKVGNVAIYDASNSFLGWIGKFGSDYGAWFPQLYVGGSGVSTARLKALNSGAVTLTLLDGDSFTLTSSSNTREVLLTNLGVVVRNSATPTTSTSLSEVGISVNNASGPFANALSSPTDARVTVQGPGSVSIQMYSTSTTAVILHTGTQVVSARKTGWTAPSGTATRSGYATSTATLTQVAEALKALIDDLHATAGHGLIG